MPQRELLALVWEQIVGMTIDTTKPTPVITWAPRTEVVLTAANTKTGCDRRVPISTRLRAILEMRRFDPNGRPAAADRFVFGNVVGQRVLHVTRAWNRAVLISHSHKPKCTSAANLVPESRAALAEINLHLHDLRREAGGWKEACSGTRSETGWATPTSPRRGTYQSGTQRTQHDAMTAYEARLANLQPPATDDGRQSIEALSETQEREETPNRTAGGRPSAIM